MHPVSAYRHDVTHRNRGMTLIELIIVITISGIIATMLAMFIVRPMEGYNAQTRRAALVDAAESALRRISRDIHRALPNSVLVADAGGAVNNVTCNVAGSICAIGTLNVMDGARYRDGPGRLIGPPLGHDHASSQFWLRFNGADTDGFNVVGFFQNIPIPFNSTNPAHCPSLQCRLAIYNLGPSVPTANAYAVAGAPAGTPVVITNPVVTTFAIANDGGGFNDEHRIVPTLGSFRFRYRSPFQRVFIVDTPVTYLCAPGPNGTLTRYANYAIAAAQSTNPGALPLSAATNVSLVATPVTACTFTYTAGTPQRGGVVTINITMADATSGDTVQLLHQVHVDNAP